MEPEACLFTTEGGHSWHSVQDVMDSLHSLSLFPRGDTGSRDDRSSSNSEHSRAYSKKSKRVLNERKVYDRIQPRTPGYPKPFEEMVDSSSSSGINKDFDVLQRDLRTVCGQGYSNELIEHYWGPNVISSDESSDYIANRGKYNVEHCSNGDIFENKSTSSQSSGNSHVFKNVSRSVEGSDTDIRFQTKQPEISHSHPHEEFGRLSVNSMIEESQVDNQLNRKMEEIKQIPVLSKTKSKKKNSPRCRNALILGLQRKQQTEMNTWMEPAETINVPPYSNPVNYKKTLQNSHNSDFIINSNDFPPLS